MRVHTVSGRILRSFLFLSVGFVLVAKTVTVRGLHFHRKKGGKRGEKRGREEGGSKKEKKSKKKKKKARR